ncbi:MarR family transcriptional regulator [Pseudooceanicola sp. CBS1P-1]|uniref:MarR family transcriptional regulator n=1 Tax=Pseudooceanicola albus TaxID=2692189 RepID=A0A6L7GA35_9RHOB|nr:MULTISPECIES: MarR family transcriptional regulator [Pseudooceanicola]MBT9384288.1 MarR family transcriptional regulator [Pseudooceanicola endophyticus]MXN20881.1 MarR family transcriptional regulator [Pseudooceanicola albus]
MTINLDTILYRWINSVAFLSRKHMAELFGANGHDVTHEEWVYLLILSVEGERSASELAEATARDRTTVTRILDGLVRKGLVSRNQDTGDRRRWVTQLTEKGRSSMDELLVLARYLDGHTMRGVSAEDLEVTVRTLRHITGTLSEPAMALLMRRGDVLRLDPDPGPAD